MTLAFYHAIAAWGRICHSEGLTGVRPFVCVIVFVVCVSFRVSGSHQGIRVKAVSASPGMCDLNAESSTVCHLMCASRLDRGCVCVCVCGCMCVCVCVYMC